MPLQDRFIPYAEPLYSGGSSSRNTSSDSLVNGYSSHAAIESAIRRNDPEYNPSLLRRFFDWLDSPGLVGDKAQDIWTLWSLFVAGTAATSAAGAGSAGAGSAGVGSAGAGAGAGVTVASATGNDIFQQEFRNSGLSQLLFNVWDGVKKYGSDMLSGLSQVGSGIIGQLGSSWLNMKNMEHLIDKQNEYNTPAAQMERFRDAGLNENLIYGLGTNGNSPQAGSIAPVDFDTSQRESRLAKMQIETQLKQTDADVAQKQSVVNLNEKQGALVDEERKQKALENSVWLENFQAELNTKLQTIENLIAEQENIRANTNNKLIENQYADSIWRLKKQAAELENQIATIQKNWQPFLNAGEIFSDVVGSFRDFGIGLGGLKSVFGNRQSQPVKGFH